MPGTAAIEEFVRHWQKVAFDSNILIGLFEDTDYSASAVNFFDSVQQHRAELWTSALTIPEVLTMPLRKADDRLVQQYQHALFDSTLMFAEIDARTAFIAAQLGAKHNLQIRDALHLASLIDASVRGFVTADQDFRSVDEIAIFIIPSKQNQRHR